MDQNELLSRLAAIQNQSAAVSSQATAVATQAAVTVDASRATTAAVAQLIADLGVTPPPQPGTGVMKAQPNGVFLDAKGKKRILRGVETWYLSGTDPVAMVNGVASLGANTISPLVMGTDLGRLKALCDAVRAKNMVLLFNPDQGGQRAFTVDANTVTLLKQYEDILMLNLETEISVDQASWTSSQWAQDRTSLVKVLRAAGYKCPLRIGSPNSGRAPLFATQAGASVLSADPEKNVFFACQLYWGTSYYQGLAGQPSGNAGRLKQLDDFAANQTLCFLSGFDLTDDVGDTGEDGMCDRCQANGLSYLHWEGRDPGGSDDDLFTSISYTTLTPLGQRMKTRWLAEAHA